MQKIIALALICSALAVTGCTTREVAAGAVGAGAGYILSKEID